MLTAIFIPLYYSQTLNRLHSECSARAFMTLNYVRSVCVLEKRHIFRVPYRKHNDIVTKLGGDSLFIED